MQNLMMSVCQHCYRIKNIAGEFPDSYLDRETMAGGVSHGICPKCIPIHHPEYAEEIYANTMC